MHFLAEQFGVRIRLNEPRLAIDPNRAQANWLVIELSALIEELENLPNTLGEPTMTVGYEYSPLRCLLVRMTRAMKRTIISATHTINEVRQTM